MSDSADGTSLGTWRVRDSTESSVPSRAIVEVLLSEGEVILVGAGDPLRFPYHGSTELSQPTARRGQDRAVATRRLPGTPHSQGRRWPDDHGTSSERCARHPATDFFPR